jgi:hypothetical protein
LISFVELILTDRSGLQIGGHDKADIFLAAMKIIWVVRKILDSANLFWRKLFAGIVTKDPIQI